VIARKPVLGPITPRRVGKGGGMDIGLIELS